MLNLDIHQIITALILFSTPLIHQSLAKNLCLQETGRVEYLQRFQITNLFKSIKLTYLFYLWFVTKYLQFSIRRYNSLISVKKSDFNWIFTWFNPKLNIHPQLRTYFCKKIQKLHHQLLKLSKFQLFQFSPLQPLSLSTIRKNLHYSEDQKTLKWTKNNITPSQRNSFAKNASFSIFDIPHLNMQEVEKTSVPKCHHFQTHLHWTNNLG